ncbi:hypothetical protein ACFL2H_10645, partial [Planctomycetota bacterium]
CGAEGVAAVELVHEIVEAIGEARAGQSLFSFRPRIRSLRNSDCRAVLAYLAISTPEQRTRLVAIWLRGQQSGPIGTEAIAQFASNNEERIRFAVAKAMHRMSGWSVLSEMRCDPSPRVRRLAKPRVARSFSDRLGDFSDSVEVVKTTMAKPAELFVSPHCDFQKRFTLRTGSMIRKVLERIRSLLAS